MWKFRRSWSYNATMISLKKKKKILMLSFLHVVNIISHQFDGSHKNKTPLKTKLLDNNYCYGCPPLLQYMSNKRCIADSQNSTIMIAMERSTCNYFCVNFPQCKHMFLLEYLDQILTCIQKDDIFLNPPKQYKNLLAPKILELYP